MGEGNDTERDGTPAQQQQQQQEQQQQQQDDDASEGASRSRSTSLTVTTTAQVYVYPPGRRRPCTADELTDGYWNTSAGAKPYDWVLRSKDCE